MISNTRGTLAVLLLVVGLLGLAVGAPSLWLQRQVLDTERFTADLGPLVENEDFQAALTSRLTSAIVERAPRLAVAEPALDTAIGRLVATPAFESAWTEALEVSHRQAMGAVRGSEIGLEVEGSMLSVQIAPLIRSLKPRLADAGFPLAFLIPEVPGQFVLVDSAALEPTTKFVRLVDQWAGKLVGVSVALLVGSILVARRPLVAVGRVGWGVGGLAVVLLGLFLLLRDPFLESLQGSATEIRVARAALDLLTQSLVPTLAVVVVGSLAVGVTASVLSRRPTAQP